MKKQRKKYERPLRLWDKQRIEKEKEILKTFGLRRKKEVWVAEALLRKFRRMTKQLAAKKDKKMEKELIEKMIKLGLLGENASLDDVLGLKVENVLERRLQTILFRKGLTRTAKQARQFIVHGQVRIGDRKISYPSYLVPRDEENKIQLNVDVQVKKANE